MLNKVLYTFIKLTFIFCTGIFLQAQSISGKISDGDKKAIPYAEVIATKEKSKKTAVCDENGNFSIKLSENGNYHLEIVKDGKKVYDKALLINGDVYEELVITSVKEKEIQEVVLSGKKKLIERKVDRLVFNVENSISATGGDALDALKVTPGLKVQNDQISMIGKNRMSVMIDDRLIQLSGDELINFLKTIKSDDIKNIEVITNPPAKYDAEGNSGIVNIKLKKAKKNAISGNLKTSYTQATHLLGSLGGGLNYQKDKLTVTSNINYSNGSVAPYQEYTIYYPNYTWFEKNNKRQFLNSLSGRVTLDYKVSDKTIMGIQYSGTLSKPIVKGRNTSSIINSNSFLDSLIITPSRLEVERKTHSLNFHSITKIDTLGTQYSVDIDYFKFKSDLDNNFSTNTYSPNNVPIPNRYISANNLSNQNIDIYSAKIDYEMPLKWINLSFGGKISFINNDSKVSYFNTTNTNPIFDPSKSNIFNYKENTQALYISGNKKLSEKWDLQLGLRLESTQTKGYSETLNQINKDDYFKLFPTFYLTYKTNENTTWGLNYNKRINRPTYSDLNPFRVYTSQYNYAEGNPFLQPFFIDNVEISLNNKNYFASVYMDYFTNGSDQITFVSNDNPIQKVIPSNFFDQTKFGTTHSYTFNNWKWLESNNMLNIHYAKTISKLSNTNIPNLSKVTINFVSNNSFVLSNDKKLRAELSFNFLSPSVAGSYITTGFYYFDLGLKYKMSSRNFEIAINALDIFRTNKVVFIQTVNGIKQENFDYSDTQKVRLSLSWNFGKTLNIQQKKQSNEEERERL